MRAYLETVSAPHSLVVVDNGSPERDLRELVAGLPGGLTLRELGSNYFPGYATNRGWEWAPPETTHYQRLDNDGRLLPGWCEALAAAFVGNVGQVGIAAEEDGPWISQPTWPVGGFSVISREVYDAGARYSEDPWRPGWEECPGFYERVRDLGYARAWVWPFIEYLDDGDLGYNRESHAARGLPPRER